MKYPLARPLLLIAALALAGCGDADSANDPGDEEQAATTSDVGDEVEADTGDGDDEAQDPDDSGTEQTGAGSNESWTGDDGWTELHDVPLPEPGQMVLTVDGQEFATDVRCGQDPVRDDESSGSMFLFSLLESGTTDDGRDFRIMVNRAIEVGGQVDEMYETGGSSAQVTLVIAGEDGNGSSVILSPHDDDPQGDLLPLVHVDPSGGFTMQGTMEVFEGDDAVAGDAVLAGRCQDGWPG